MKMRQEGRVTRIRIDDRVSLRKRIQFKDRVFLRKRIRFISRAVRQNLIRDEDSTVLRGERKITLDRPPVEAPNPDESRNGKRREAAATNSNSKTTATTTTLKPTTTKA